MKSLNQYIKESLLDDEDKIISKKYIYKPQTKNELISIINKEIEKQKGKDIINLNMIDTSKISDMCGLFTNSIYNFDISKWDVSNVEDMYNMFMHCKNFNSDLSKWDVSNVKNMSYMFYNCESFNSDLSKWDVSKVKNMTWMFYDCKNFNYDLSKWDVSKVINMSYMFYGCENFNYDLSKWNVSNVKDMYSMFYCGASLKKLPDWYIKHIEGIYNESLLDNEEKLINKKDIIIPDNNELKKIAKTNKYQLIWYMQYGLIFEYYGKHINGCVRQGHTLNPFTILTNKTKKCIILKFNTEDYLLSDNKELYKSVRDGLLDNEKINELKEYTIKKFNNKLNTVDYFIDYAYIYIIDENNNFYECVSIRDKSNLLNRNLVDILPSGKFLYINIKKYSNETV